MKCCSKEFLVVVFDCSLKGVVYKMAVLLDHRNFCIQGDGKGNSHLASVIGCLLIK